MKRETRVLVMGVLAMVASQASAQRSHVDHLMAFALYNGEELVQCVEFRSRYSVPDGVEFSPPASIAGSATRVSLPVGTTCVTNFPAKRVFGSCAVREAERASGADPRVRVSITRTSYVYRESFATVAQRSCRSDRGRWSTP